MNEQQIKEFIEHDGLATAELVYYPPSQIVAMLAQKDITVYKMLIVRLYEKMGIVWRNGLWIKELK